MLRLLLLLLAFSNPFAALAQSPQFAYRIVFSDKKGAPPLTDAANWLSARSLARRQAFSIPLDSTDRPVSPLYVDSVLALTGGWFHNASRWLNQCVILTSDSNALPALRTKSWIKSIDWVGYFPQGLHQMPADTGHNPKSEPATPLQSPAATARQTGDASYYGASFPQTNLVHGDTLHDQGFRGKGKLIAVLDVGFSGTDTHPGFNLLRAQGRLLETHDFVHDSDYIYAYDIHGTQVLSTIAGLIPGSFVGTAPDAQFALYVTDDASFTDATYEMDNLIAGMERADSIGADIISASLGYNTFNSPYPWSLDKSALDGVTTMVSRASNLAVAKGMLYVTSSGNEGGNTWNFLLSPGDADSALTVGAVTPSGAAASFSSPGPNTSGRVKPEVCLQGAPATVLMAGGGVGASSGTSFAVPQAAGYAACLMQAFPSLPPYFFRKTFEEIASLYPSSNARLGYGIPDFRKAQKLLRKYLPDTLSGLQVFPNPFDGQIQISSVSDSAQFQARLLDVQGRSLGFQTDRSGGQVTLMPTGDLRPGLYFLELFVNGQRSVHKMLRH